MNDKKRRGGWMAAVWLAMLAGGGVAVAAPYAETFAEDWRRMEGIQPKGYVCGRAARAPVIDGRMDEAEWGAAPWTEEFQDIEGAARPRPRFRTRAKMLWDDTYLYIAAEMEEPHVWGTLTNHDAVIFHDNDFEVFIDPDGDTHEYYEFEMNALNTGWDLFLPKPYKDGGSARDAWEIPGLKTAVHIEGTLNDPRDRDRGWTVELAFPWRVLGEYTHQAAPPKGGDQWRMGFSRVEWEVEVVEGRYRKLPGRKEDNWVWSPQGIVDMHRPERWGYVQFGDGPAAEARFVPDATRPARDVLQAVYYAQRDFQKQQGRWASSLKELGFEASRWRGRVRSLELKATGRGYRAVATVKPEGGTVRTLVIREDSRIWETREGVRVFEPILE